MATIPSNKGFLLKWTFACGFGEFFGIGIAAGIGFSFFLVAGEPDTITKKILTLARAVCAGIIEGLVTGSLQWIVLKGRFEEVRARSWLFYTALGAAVAWIIGMTYPTFFVGQASSSSAAMVEPSTVMLVLLAAASGIVLGALFGFFQWLVLRRNVLKASWWILANAVAWMVGMVFIYLGASLPTADTAMATVALIGAVSGLLAGMSVGAITAGFLGGLILPHYGRLLVLD
jgi:hypothetical protein